MITSTSKSRVRLTTLICLLIAAFSAFAYEWEHKHRMLQGVFADYGGGLGDPYKPTRDDHKIMFSIEGEAAKTMFDGMGPDVQEICAPEPGERVRKRDGGRLYCVRSPKGDYQCNFGFDLRTGKSIGGIVC